VGKKGRPSAWETKIEPRLDEIKEWARAGATNREIAEALDVGLSVFQRYLAEKTDFRESVERARLKGVPDVKLALYRRAVGFDYTETKIIKRSDGDVTTELVKKKALPDVGAIQTYLRNYTTEFRDKDFDTTELKKLEYELRKTIAENNDF